MITNTSKLPYQTAVRTYYGCICLLLVLFLRITKCMKKKENYLLPAVIPCQPHANHNVKIKSHIFVLLGVEQKSGNVVWSVSAALHHQYQQQILWKSDS